MKKLAMRTIRTKIGTLLLQSNGSKLVSVDFAAGHPQKRDEDRILESAIDELGRYFQRKLTKFRTPLELRGTAFQQRVLECTQSIPFGEIISYQNLSMKIGAPKAYRACGQALGRNPFLIVIPCHRVCASDGGLGGYAGGIRIKEALLRFERGA